MSVINEFNESNQPKNNLSVPRIQVAQAPAPAPQPSASEFGVVPAGGLDTALGIPQVQNQDVKLVDQAVDEQIAIADAGLSQRIEDKILNPLPPDPEVGLPISEMQTPVGFDPIQLPEVEQTFNLSQQDEMLRTGADFDTALDQNALLQSHYPTVYSGVPVDLERLADQGLAMSAEAASRVPKPEELLRPQVLPQTRLNNGDEFSPDSTRPTGQGQGYLPDWLYKGGAEGSKVDILKGQFGESGNGALGAVIYGFGGVQSTAIGGISYLKGKAEEATENLPTWAKTLLKSLPGANVVSAATSLVDGRRDLDVVTAPFAKGRQYSFTDGVGSAQSPVGIVQPIDNITQGVINSGIVPSAAVPYVAAGVQTIQFTAGLALDVLTDPLDALNVFGAPFRAINRVTPKPVKNAVKAAANASGVKQVRRIATTEIKLPSLGGKPTPKQIAAPTNTQHEVVERVFVVSPEGVEVKKAPSALPPASEKTTGTVYNPDTNVFTAGSSDMSANGVVVPVPEKVTAVSVPKPDGSTVKVRTKLTPETQAVVETYSKQAPVEIEAKPQASIVSKDIGNGALVQTSEATVAPAPKAKAVAEAQLVRETAELQRVEVEQPTKVKEQQVKVQQAEQAVVSAPVSQVEPTTPAVSARVFQGEMTVSEIAKVISENVPGTQIDAPVVNKSTRDLRTLTALGRLIPAPDGKPLFTRTTPYKTYDDLLKAIRRRAPEDAVYHRIFAREGAAIPEELLTSSELRIVLDKPKPFTAQREVVIDNPNVERIIEGQWKLEEGTPTEAFAGVELMKGATDVKVENGVRTYNVPVYNKKPEQQPTTTSLENINVDKDYQNRVDRQNSIVKHLSNVENYGDDTERVSRIASNIETLNSEEKISLAVGLSNSLSGNSTGLSGDYVSLSNTNKKDVATKLLQQVENDISSKVAAQKQAELEAQGKPKAVLAAISFTLSNKDRDILDNLELALLDLDNSTKLELVSSLLTGKQLSINELNELSETAKISTARGLLGQVQVEDVKSTVKTKGFENKQKATGKNVADFRGKLKKERDTLVGKADGIKDAQEWEQTMNRIEEIEDELTTPNLQENEAHLEQLQRTVIPDKQIGKSPEVIQRTEKKFEIENRLSDVSTHVRDLEYELTAQQAALEETLTRIDGTADVSLSDEPVVTVPDIDPGLERPIVVGSDGMAREATALLDMVPPGTDVVVTRTESGVSFMYHRGEKPEEVEAITSAVNRAMQLVPGLKSTRVVMVSGAMRREFANTNTGTLVSKLLDFAKLDTPPLGMYLVDEDIIYISNSALSNNSPSKVLIHEMGHAISIKGKLGSSNGRRSLVNRWKKTVGDEPHPTDYAKTNTEEDIADSVAAFVLDPTGFTKEFPKRTEALSNILNLRQEQLGVFNGRTFVHGSRLNEYTPANATTRTSWGVGVHLHSNPDNALNQAIADIEPHMEVAGRTFGTSSNVYEVKTSIYNPLDADSIAETQTVNVFRKALYELADDEALEDSVDDILKALNYKASSKPKVSTLFDTVEKAILKHIGADTVGRDALNKFQSNIGKYLMDAGYDAVHNADELLVLDPSKVKVLSKELVSDGSSPVDIAAARYNIESMRAKNNPNSPTSQIAHMEAAARVQSEMIEVTKRKLEMVKEKQMSVMEEMFKNNEELERLAAAEKVKKGIVEQKRSTRENVKQNEYYSRGHVQQPSQAQQVADNLKLNYRNSEEAAEKVGMVVEHLNEGTPLDEAIQLVNSGVQGKLVSKALPSMDEFKSMNVDVTKLDQKAKDLSVYIEGDDVRARWVRVHDTLMGKTPEQVRNEYRLYEEGADPVKQTTTEDFIKEQLSPRASADTVNETFPDEWSTPIQEGDNLELYSSEDGRVNMFASRDEDGKAYVGFDVDGRQQRRNKASQAKPTRALIEMSKEFQKFLKSPAGKDVFYSYAAHRTVEEAVMKASMYQKFGFTVDKLTPDADTGTLDVLLKLDNTGTGNDVPQFTKEELTKLYELKDEAKETNDTSQFDTYLKELRDKHNSNTVTPKKRSKKTANPCEF